VRLHAEPPEYYALKLGNPHAASDSPARTAGKPGNAVVRLGPAALAAAILLAGLAGCVPTSFLITPVPAARELQEFEVQRESFWANRKIALIDIDGVLHNRRRSSLLGLEEENPVSVLKEKLDKAAADRQVKAVVLRINSPGGGVTASDLMYRLVRNFREQSGKPVVACLMDVGTSGAYYLACAAEQIFAHPTSVTGSIGVIMVAPDLSGTMQKIGLRANVIKSGDLKDAGSPLREMTERDRMVFQRMIDAMYERFLGVVAEGRPGMDPDKLRPLADGRVYLAQEAKAHGLVDEIGTVDDAIRAARQAAGLEQRKIVVVQYARAVSHRPNVYAQPPGEPVRSINLIHVDLPEWLTGSDPQFLYLWVPGM
jgi:protease-4